MARDDLKMKFVKDAAKAMKAKKLTQSGIANATGLKYHIVHDCITRGATRLTDNVQKIADYLELDDSYLEKPASSKAKVTKRAMNDGRYMVTTTGEKFERTEIMTEEEVAKMEGREKKATVEPVEELTVPTMTDESPELKLNNRELWVDGKKYTEDTIRNMLDAEVAEHREHVELEQKLEEAQKHIDIQSEENEKAAKVILQLQAKCTELDKEAIKWQVQANEYREQLAEIKAENANTMDLQNMTIGDAVKHYRALKRILKDEVLQ